METLKNIKEAKEYWKATAMDLLNSNKKLEANKKELLEGLEKLLYGDFFNNVEKQDFIESLIQKYKK